MQLGDTVGEGETQYLARINESPQVLIQSENRGASFRQSVTTNSLEICRPIVKRMRQYMHLRFFPADHLSVQPNCVCFQRHDNSRNPTFLNFCLFYVPEALSSR